MFTTAEEVLAFITAEDVEFVDVRFTDLPGVQQHFNLPAAAVDASFFTDGQLFDGSSIRGFAQIHKSDMKLIPDVTTAYVDPFRKHKTLNIVCSIVEPRTGEPYERDPRQIAAKAEEYLRSTGVADTVYFGPEAEFYLFDEVRYESTINGSFYRVDSEEGSWNSGREEEGGNLGYKTSVRAGTSRSRRWTTRQTCATTSPPRSSGPGSRSSGPTTRSAPAARQRSTTGSTP